MFDLKGKTALVTGASKGIGKGIAQMLHAEGCYVAVNSRSAEELSVVVAELPGAIAVEADVTVPEQAALMVAQAVDALGHLDIVICNVGSGQSVPPGKEDYQEWQRVFATNLFSTTNTVEAAREALALSCGVVICISSICGLEVIPGAPVTYSAAKAALHAYVRGIARPLGDQGVRINAIAPGNIVFDGSVWSRKMSEDADAVQAMLEREVSLNCLGKPSDIADLVAYLVSPRASFATGAVFTLDGGQVRS